MKTVTICGSMKFETEMQRIAFLLETKHNMNVLQCVYNVRFLYKGIIINHNKKLSQPTLKRRFFKKKAAFFSWPGLGKEWC